MDTETKKRKYERRSTTAVVLPIDIALLELLPDEGQMLGYKPIALQVRSILRRPEFEGVSGTQIAGRLKSLQFQGYTCTQVTLPTQGGLGWQRTAKGRELLNKNGKVA